MEEDMYEMRIPPGVTERLLAQIVTQYDLELKPSDYGPVLYGSKEKLEKAQDDLIRALNERLKELKKDR